MYKYGEVITYSIVDDDDYEYLNMNQWHLFDQTKRKGTHTVYAVRYSRVNGKRKAIFMHREILLRANIKLNITDHINQNGLDNQKHNLRSCTQRENTLNQRTFFNKYKGVWYDKKRGKWQAKIWLNRKGIHLGRFNTEIEAAVAYNAKAVEIYGEYACLNKIAENKVLQCV